MLFRNKMAHNRKYKRISGREYKDTLDLFFVEIFVTLKENRKYLFPPKDLLNSILSNNMVKKQHFQLKSNDGTI